MIPEVQAEKHVLPRPTCLSPCDMDAIIATEANGAFTPDYGTRTCMSEPFSFIDLFAGIGGIRIAFERAGGQCVFSSEYDRFAQLTYAAYFGESPDFSSLKSTHAQWPEIDPPGDITQLDPGLIPDHDILTGGFPCQPFSLAGVSKKNSLGRPHGFDDPTQGTLFFNIKEIIRAKRPAAFLLENVKHLKGHDKGRTWDVITDVLTRQLQYEIFPRVIDAAGWVPQHRERIYIVGFRTPAADPTGRQNWRVDKFDELWDLEPPTDGPDLGDILLEDVPEKYTLGPGTWATLKRHKAKHEARGNGFGYGLIRKPYDGQVTRTMSARYHKDGAEILIDQPGEPRPRRLTPFECSRLMGFPTDFQKLFDFRNGVEQPVSDTQAYRQFGNSVAVPLVADIADLVVTRLMAEGAI